MVRKPRLRVVFAVKLASALPTLSLQAFLEAILAFAPC